MPIRRVHHPTDTRSQLPTGQSATVARGAPENSCNPCQDSDPVYLDFTELPCHAGTPQDLVNPWTLAFGPAGDALYVATDPNHRTVHRFDAAGKLVRAERCADEAPNYLLCV